MNSLLLKTGILLHALGSFTHAQDRAKRMVEHYKIESISPPANIDPQVGALTVLKDGRIAVCFHHGQVEIWDPQKQGWQHFAEGLHEPLGILEEADGSLLVMQRPELTRLRDTDKDGVADVYQNVWDDYGMSGNYHEFAFGPALGPDGRLYMALNLASNGASIRPEIRGEWSPLGMPREDFYKDWGKMVGGAGRMYSRVEWRGWIMALDVKTGVAEPYACGFRSPDGIGFDAKGRLLVADNEGDWRPTSELHVVKKDGFYGHPGSLVWRKGWDQTPALKVPIEKLETMRTAAAIWFPHNVYANSPTQPLVIPKTPAWGPFGGQTIIGEMNVPRVLRLLLEEVDGVSQGACLAFIEHASLKSGIHRLAFSGDTLWIGRTHLSWAGGEGVGKVTPSGKKPFDLLDMRITPKGFRLEFTEPLAADSNDVAKWKVERFTYPYHVTYGTPNVGDMKRSAANPVKIKLSNGNMTAEVQFAEVKPNYVYDFDLKGIQSTSQHPPLNPKVAYTVRRIPK